MSDSGTVTEPRVPPGFLEVNGPVAIAHRGGLGRFAENSAEAFADAVAQGFRYLETDVHATLDGEVVAFHDANLYRMCGLDARLAQVSRRTLSDLSIGRQEHIPTLEELLVQWPHVYFNIDPKSDAVVAPLLELIERCDAHARVCIGSFTHARLRTVRDALGDRVATSASPREVLVLRMASLGLEWPPMPDPGPRCVQVPLVYRGVKVVDRRFVETAHARGLPVHVWTVNEAATMHRLLDLGVDGLMSDELSVLADVFAERDLPLAGRRPAVPADRA